MASRICKLPTLMVIAFQLQCSVGAGAAVLEAGDCRTCRGLLSRRSPSWLTDGEHGEMQEETSLLAYAGSGRMVHDVDRKWNYARRYKYWYKRTTTPAPTTTPGKVLSGSFPSTAQVTVCDGTSNYSTKAIEDLAAGDRVKTFDRGEGTYVAGSAAATCQRVAYVLDIDYVTETEYVIISYLQPNATGGGGVEKTLTVSVGHVALVSNTALDGELPSVDYSLLGSKFAYQVEAGDLIIVADVDGKLHQVDVTSVRRTMLNNAMNVMPFGGDALEIDGVVISPHRRGSPQPIFDWAGFDNTSNLPDGVYHHDTSRIKYAQRWGLPTTVTDSLFVTASTLAPNGQYDFYEALRDAGYETWFNSRVVTCAGAVGELGKDPECTLISDSSLGAIGLQQAIMGWGGRILPTAYAQDPMFDNSQIDTFHQEAVSAAATR